MAIITNASSDIASALRQRRRTKCEAEEERAGEDKVGQRRSRQGRKGDRKQSMAVNQ